MNSTKMWKKYHLSCESALTAGHCMLLSTPSDFECDVRRWLDAPWPSDKMTGRKEGIFQKGENKHLSNGRRFYLWSTKNLQGQLKAECFFISPWSRLSAWYSKHRARVYDFPCCVCRIYAPAYTFTYRWQTLISIAPSSIWLYTAGLEGWCWYEGFLLLWTWLKQPNIASKVRLYVFSKKLKFFTLFWSLTYKLFHPRIANSNTFHSHIPNRKPVYLFYLVSVF